MLVFSHLGIGKGDSEFNLLCSGSVRFEAVLVNLLYFRFLGSSNDFYSNSILAPGDFGLWPIVLALDTFSV